MTLLGTFHCSHIPFSWRCQSWVHYWPDFNSLFGSLEPIFLFCSSWLCQWKAEGLRVSAGANPLSLVPQLTTAVLLFMQSLPSHSNSSCWPFPSERGLHSYLMGSVELKARWLGVSSVHALSSEKGDPGSWKKVSLRQLFPKPVKPSTSTATSPFVWVRGYQSRYPKISLDGSIYLPVPWG